MPSGTSFFNVTLFRKNLVRFWPIWGIYTVMLAFLLPINLFLDYRYLDKDYLPRQIYSLLGGGGLILPFCFAILAAMAVFSYLYNARSVQLFHALPVKRGGLFLTNYLSGLSFLVVPIWFTGLCALVVQGALGMGALGTTGLWIFLSTLETLFFYSFAVFCAMFTGHLLALPAFYIILNFLSLGLYSLLQSLFSQFVYGFSRLDWLRELAFWLSPYFRLSEDVFVSYNSDLPIFFEGMPAIFLYGLIGIVLTILALVAYRKRRLESAGDVVSVRWVRPIFKYGVAFCAAIFLGSLLHDIFRSALPVGVWPLLICLLLAGAVGYFAAEMLLKKTFKVFRKSWKGVAVFSLALTLAVCAMEFDIFGFNRVPNPNAVTSVTLYGVDTYPQDSASYIPVTFTEADDIALVTELHQQLAAAKSAAPRDESRAQIVDADQEEFSRYITVDLNYELQNGGKLYRTYNLPIYLEDLQTPGTVPHLLYRLINRPDRYYDYYFQDSPIGSDLSIIDATIALYNAATGDYETVTIPDEANRNALLAAMGQDLRNGGLGRRYLFDNKERREVCAVGDINIVLYRPTTQTSDANGKSYTTKENSWYLTITPQTSALHTLAVLKELGVIDETHLFLTHADDPEDYRIPTAVLVPETQTNVTISKK